MHFGQIKLMREQFLACLYSPSREVHEAMRVKGVLIWVYFVICQCVLFSCIFGSSSDDDIFEAVKVGNSDR